MSRWTLRILAPLALLAPFVSGAEAGAVYSSGGALSSFGRLSPVQTVQFNSFGSNCYYGDGWNGRGWYQCGDEWNNGFGWVGPFNNFGGSAVGQHHRRVFTVLHPRAPNSVYPGALSRGLGAGAPPSSGFHAGGALVSPGIAGRGFHGGLHQFHAAGVPHVGAPASPGVVGAGFHGSTGVGRFHTGVGIPHIVAPVSPGFTGGGGLHGLGGATGVHIGPPPSPSFAGVGGFHAGLGIGAPHIGAPASPGFVGAGGFHGAGGIGGFQGGGAAFGQGGIGHR
jgi:hypothetical protein